MEVKVWSLVVAGFIFSLYMASGFFSEVSIFNRSRKHQSLYEFSHEAAFFARHIKTRPLTSNELMTGQLEGSGFNLTELVEDMIYVMKTNNLPGVIPLYFGPKEHNLIQAVGIMDGDEPIVLFNPVLWGLDNFEMTEIQPSPLCPIPSRRDVPTRFEMEANVLGKQKLSVFMINNAKYATILTTLVGHLTGTDQCIPSQ